jgi:hypothetical protein
MVISRKVQMTKNLKKAVVASGSLMMLLLVSIPSIAQNPKKQWTDGEIEKWRSKYKEREIAFLPLTAISKNSASPVRTNQPPIARL